MVDDCPAGLVQLVKSVARTMNPLSMLRARKLTFIMRGLEGFAQEPINGLPVRNRVYRLGCF